MSAIITLDSPDFKSLNSNPYSDYPCLRHMYNAANIFKGETSGSHILYDQAGNADISLFSITEIVQGITVAPGSNGAQRALASGSFDQPVTKSVIMLTLADLNSGGNGVHKLGNAVQPGGGMNQVGTVPITRAGNNTDFATVTPTYGAAIELHATIFTPSAKLQAMRLQTNGTFAANNGAADVTSVPSTVEFDPSTLLDLSSMNATCLIFLDDTPSDNFMESMMRWVMPLWKVGNFVMYPGLRGRG